MEPIAVIGLSFKMSQEAVNEDELWDVLQNKRNLMTDWPDNRIHLDGFYDGSADPYFVKGRGACFMSEDPKGFDAPFFSIGPQEAAGMDPQQRWLLETAYHTFENAGLTLQSLRNSPVAVFEASISDDYARMTSKDPDRTHLQSTTGNASSSRPNRVSWWFDLLGPSVHVDTACSSSLIAVDMACQYIRGGDAETALVLGCNLILGPDISLGLGNQGFLSPSSVCHSFDHRADGYGRGEGFIGIVIKPLSAAIRDGNMIRALIRGTGSNSDGHTPSITQPSAESQEKLIRHVYGKFGLDLALTRYFEAHGTGTPAGDPIEMKAIGRVFRTSRSAEEPLYVGSIKANVGHIEGGAGLAGIVKAILVLERGVIPPNALFEKLNPDIDATFYHTEIPVKSIPWPSTGPRRVSVNSFGMGGANAHVVLDDALSYLREHGLQGYQQTRTNNEDADAHGGTVLDLSSGKTWSNGHLPASVSNASETSQNKHAAASLHPHQDGVSDKTLLIWTASHENGISRVTDSLRLYCKAKVVGSTETLDRLAYTLSARRTHLPWRTFSVVDSLGLDRGLVPAITPVRASTSPAGIAFVFTGQGAQYADMGYELMLYPKFRKTISRVNNVLEELSCEWSITDELRNKKNINLPEYSQPLCTAIQIALIELLREFGIVPVATAGHSSGEIAAAYAAGALSLESAAKVAYYRGKAAGELRSMIESASSCIPRGAMMSVNLSQEEAESYLKKLSTISEDADESALPRGAVHVACINSPTNCTLSGPENAIDMVNDQLQLDGIFSQKLNTGGIAYHSPAMQTVTSGYLENLKSFLGDEGTLVHCSQVYIASSVTGAPMSPTEFTKPRYWVDNFVFPVRFWQALSNVMSRDARANHVDYAGSELSEISDIVEIGPHSALRRPILETLQAVTATVTTTVSKRQKEVKYAPVLVRKKSPVQTVLELVGQLFCGGHPVSLLAANRQHTNGPGSSSPALLVDLPDYPFDHTHKFWDEPRLSLEHRLRRAIKQTADGSSALLGRPVSDWNPLEPRWRNFLSIEALPWIGDHIINNTNLLAGTCMVVMAVEAARQHFENSSASSKHKISGFLLKEVRYINVIIIGQTAQDGIETQTQLRSLNKSGNEKGPVQHEVKIFTCNNERRWTECFQCTIKVQIEEATAGEVDRGFEQRMENERLSALHQHAMQVCSRPIESTRFYDFLKTRTDTQYRGAFALLNDIRWDGSRFALARINLMPSSSSPKKYERHPVGAVLDAAAHLTLAFTSNGLEKVPDTVVLSGLTDVWISDEMFKHPSSPGSSSNLDLLLHGKNPEKFQDVSASGLDSNGSILFTIGLIEMAPVATAIEDLSPTACDEKKVVYGIDWRPKLNLMSPESLSEYMNEILVDAEHENSMLDFFPLMESTLIAAAREAVSDDASQCMENASMSEYLNQQLSMLSERRMDGKEISQKTEGPLGKEKLEAMLAECERKRPSWKGLVQVARNLKLILQGSKNSLPVGAEGGLNDQLCASLFEGNYTPRLHAFLELASHENRDLRVLEVGAGTGTLTRQAMSAFKKIEDRTGATSFFSYTYTDISPAHFPNAQKEFHGYEGRMIFKTLDLNQRFNKEDGYELGSYDLILVGNALYTAENLGYTLRGLRKLLASDGHLVFLEIVSPASACASIGLRVQPDLWPSPGKLRQQSPFLSESEWDELLLNVGFSGNHLILRDYETPSCHFSSIIVTRKRLHHQDEGEAHNGSLSRSLLSLPASSVSSTECRKLVIIIDAKSKLQAVVAGHLCCEAKNDSQVLQWYNVVENGHDKVLLAAASDPNVVIVSLLELTTPFLVRMEAKSFYQLQKLISGIRNFLWVTVARMEDPEYSLYSAMKGFLRGIRGEGVERFIVTLEIELLSKAELDASECSGHIKTVIDHSFTSSPGEIEYILKKGLLGTLRLIENVSLNTSVNRLINPTMRDGPWATGQALKFSVATPGVLDSFRFIEDTAHSMQLQPDEVEIEGKAWPLSFRDLLLALGRMDYHTPGLEVAGVVTRVGSAVNQSIKEGSTAISPGDRVVLAMARVRGSMRTYPRGLGIFTYKIPDGVSFEAAAACLNPAMTAYHSFVNLARLKRGEKVLIHSAAGATGQMAIWVAKSIGAEIFATVGHDAKKKQLIDDFGIPEDHIFYSRNTSFAKGIKRITNGAGVDVVLNSLSGEALQASWECVAPFGRFVELGKVDILSNSSLPMYQFAGSTSFFAVDLYLLGRQNPVLYQSILEAVLELLDQGLIRNPYPLHCYPLSKIEEGYRFMQSGNNTGRIILKANDNDIVHKLTCDLDPCKLDETASYLVVGGLGGVGRAILQWMAEKGARNLITISRSGRDSNSPSVQDCISGLEHKGVQVLALKCDVSSSHSLSLALKECYEKMPPIKGCINSAMVLYDAAFEGMTYDQWTLSLKSKADTSWNLHQQLSTGSLDFFILLSSLGGIYGPIAQSNYAAGCSIQDAIAYQRASFGENAVSIDLGWMRTVGIVAEKAEYQRNRENARDMRQVETSELLGMLSMYCQPDNTHPSQVLLGAVTPADFLKNGEEPIHLLQRPMFTGFVKTALLNESHAQGDGLESPALLFRQASGNERTEIVVSAVISRLSKSLNISAVDIEPSKLLSDYGVDSLMAVELRNWIGKEFKANIAVFDITSGITILALGEMIRERSKVSGEAEKTESKSI